jgi:RNA recognition motif-containing protein
VSWQDLKDHFKSTGLDVVRADIMTSHDGRSKGCGLVEFASLAEASQALETLNNTEIKGRAIFVATVSVQEAIRISESMLAISVGMSPGKT